MTGRPVDIEIVPRAHAILSASSAERWLNCTPSARIEEALPDRKSEYSQDGTAAHAFGELRLNYKLGNIDKDEYLAGYEATKTLYADQIKEWDHSDWEAISSYVEYVLDEALRLEAKVYVEQRVDYSKFAQGGFGTADAILVSRNQNTIKVVDLKFGKGVPVSAMDNPQGKLYALGALIAFKNVLFDTIEWTIHQPRLNNVSSDSCHPDELLDWAKNVVAPKAKLAWEGKGKLVPTEKGCYFCKAAPTCRALAAKNLQIAKKEFAVDLSKPDPRLEDHLLTMDEVARILPDIDGIIAWANRLKGYALEAARDRGEVIPGYKLVRGRANRAWVPGKDVEAELIDELSKMPSVSTDILYTEPTLKSVAQVEKTLGKKLFTEVTESRKLVATPPGTPALVPDTDPRPAINAAAEAAADFAAVTPKKNTTTTKTGDKKS